MLSTSKVGASSCLKSSSKIFESSNSDGENVIKEPEMFDESNLEEDFEIPAFLRRQKN